MIIVKISSGLGNQLFQYVLGRQLSLTKNTSLKLDTSFFNTQSLRNYKLDNYNIKVPIASEADVAKLIGVYSSKKLSAKLYRCAERLLSKLQKRYYKEDVWWVYEEKLFSVSSNVFIEGYWQHYKYYENINNSILDELTLKEQYPTMMEGILSSICDNSSSVSIHIRRGDYSSDPQMNKLFGVLSLEYYIAAIKYIKEKIVNPSFYVFSDDLVWARENLNIEGGVTYVDGGKDYIDLDLMSKCKHNIIANSSFSWWGAFLNRNPGKIVIAPQRWVIPKEINNRIHLQLPSWIKM